MWLSLFTVMLRSSQSSRIHFLTASPIVIGITSFYVRIPVLEQLQPDAPRIQYTVVLAYLPEKQTGHEEPPSTEKIAYTSNKCRPVPLRN